MRKVSGTLQILDMMGMKQNLQSMPEILDKLRIIVVELVK